MLTLTSVFIWILRGEWISGTYYQSNGFGRSRTSRQRFNWPFDSRSSDRVPSHRRLCARPEGEFLRGLSPLTSIVQQLKWLCQRYFDFCCLQLSKSNDSAVLIRATSGVMAAWGFHYYLTEYCSCHVSWDADQLRLPTNLPALLPTRVDSLDQSVCLFLTWFDWIAVYDWIDFLCSFLYPYNCRL